MGQSPKFYFFRIWSCCISNIRKWHMHQHGTKYFAKRSPPWTLGCGQKVKIQLYQNMVMLHIKLKGMTNAATRRHIFCPYTHPRPLGGVKGQNIFLKGVMLHYHCFGMELGAPCKHIFCPNTHPRPLGWGQKIKKNLKVPCHVAYKIKGNGA